MLNFHPQVQSAAQRYLYILWKHKERIKHPKGPDPASRLQSRAADPVLKPFKFLFAAYRPEMWWYEVYETVRRLAMNGLLVLVPNQATRLGVASFLSFLSILMHTAMGPYADRGTMPWPWLVTSLCTWCISWANKFGLGWCKLRILV